MKDIIKEVLDRFIMEETDYAPLLTDEDGYCSEELFNFLVECLPNQSMPYVNSKSDDCDIEFDDKPVEGSPIADALGDAFVAITCSYYANFAYVDNGYGGYSNFEYELKDVEFSVGDVIIDDNTTIPLTKEQRGVISDYLYDNFTDASYEYDGADEYDPGDDAYDEMKDWY